MKRSPGGAAARPRRGLLRSDVEDLAPSLDQIPPGQPVLYPLAGVPGVCAGGA